jgi:hypothetical protein
MKKRKPKRAKRPGATGLRAANRRKPRAAAKQPDIAAPVEAEASPDPMRRPFWPLDMMFWWMPRGTART